VTLISYAGTRRTTYGYRFEYRGRIYKCCRWTSKVLAGKAEERERERLEREYFEGQYGPLAPRDLAWADAVEQFETAKGAKASLAWDRRRLAWWGACFAGQGITSLRAITPDAIDRAKAELAREQYSPASIVRHLAVLRTLCRLAVVRWGVLRKDPTALVDWPHVATAEPSLPDTTATRALIEQADPLLAAWILTAIVTSLRKGQLLKLRSDDLNAQPGMLRVAPQKRTPERLLPLPEWLGRILGHLARPDGRLFTWFPEERWRALRTAVGYPKLRLHDLRHLAGTLLSESGFSDQLIARYMGHAPGSGMTRRYTHPRAPAMRDAANVLSLAVRRGRRGITKSSTTAG
jgi:integrase